MNILGLSAFYHDSAAALVRDGEIIAAAQEERFSRKKHDADFPRGAMEYCLRAGGVGPEGPDAVIFYEKPLDKFDRLLETCFSVAPRGFRSFLVSMPLWLREKLWIPLTVEREMARAGFKLPRETLFSGHHEAHAASAFYPSPFERSAILTVDGVGEWATAAIGRGEDSQVHVMEEMRFPHSLGLLYSAFTYFCGFRVNDGEYKLMGLAPYGKPSYAGTIREKLVDLREDGSFRLNMEYFGYLDGLAMTSQKFDALFGGPPRKMDGPLTMREADLARSVQEVTEDILLRMARHASELTGEGRLCLAGGVALNCVANGRLRREGPFRDIWIQPASGDAGGALGAALAYWHMGCDGPRKAVPGDAMKGAFLGPEWTDNEIGDILRREGVSPRQVAGAEWPREVAKLVAAGRVVGLFQGRMEFGPRALGNRSIIADARVPGMRERINAAVKRRESFRPFAPAVLAEGAGEYFELEAPSPYMLLTAQVRKERLREPAGPRPASVDGMARLELSDIPAVTHVDGSARIQTVSREQNPDFHAVLAAFKEMTGCGLVLNTSFNAKDEPIVCSPVDALRCFREAGLDDLAIGPYIVSRVTAPSPAGNIGGVSS